MKTYSKLVLSVCSVSLVAVASAQPAAKPADKAPATTPPAAGKAAPATAPAKAEMPPMPKPAPELAAYIKSATGTWRCTGTMPGMDGSSTPLKSTQKIKGDLDG